MRVGELVMEGLFFYWICWMFWIIVTFLIPKSNIRTKFAIWILITISVSKIYLTIGSLDISCSYVSILIGGFLMLGSRNHKSLQIFSAFTIMIGYSSLLIWETNAPVWLFMPKLIIIPLLCALLTMFISKQYYNRLANSIIGISGGEFVYSLLLSNYSISKTIGDLMFLDTLLISLLLIGIVEIIQRGKEKILLLHTTKQNSI